MIVKCDNSWARRIGDYIDNDYPECPYLFLDFKKYGFSVDYVTIWVQTTNDEITCVVLKYHTGIHLYSKTHQFNAVEIALLINSERPDMICGRRNIIDSLAKEDTLPAYETEYGYIGYCKQVDMPLSCFAEKAQKDDFPKIAQLLYMDDGIGASYDLEELGKQMYQRSSQGFVRNYIIRKNGNPVCHVCTGAEYGHVAIISGVVTHVDFRGQGYATSLLSYVSKELIDESKKVYSVYYTNEARYLHHKVGFIDYCDYAKMYKRNH